MRRFSSGFNPSRIPFQLSPADGVLASYVHQYLVLFGAVLSITGWTAYIKNTLNGTTRPNRVTYAMWSVAPLIATVAAVVKGVTWAALPVFMSGFCPLLVFL